MLHIRTVYSGTAATMAKGMGVMKLTMRGWLENAYIATLLHWHKEIRPKHFQKSAESEYGYRPRQTEYMVGKQACEGHTRPLVYSGESERATERMQIRLAARSATLAMSPGNLAFVQKGGPNMREELTTVSLRDVDDMARVFTRTMDEQINQRHDWFEKTLG